MTDNLTRRHDAMVRGFTGHFGHPPPPVTKRTKEMRNYIAKFFRSWDGYNAQNVIPDGFIPKTGWQTK